MPPHTIKPFTVRVLKVTDGGADVANAGFVLENETTGGSVPSRNSDQSDSNFAINLADASGVDWTVGDTIKITATKGAKIGVRTHSIVPGDNGKFDFGIVTIAGGGGGMPGPPAAPIDTYNVFVTAVTVDGTPASGATITLYNLTKGTDIARVSSESNSNIAFSLADLGDWDLGDTIRVKAAHSGHDQTSDHPLESADLGKFDFGIIAITAGAGDAVPIIMFF